MIALPVTGDGLVQSTNSDGGLILAKPLARCAVRGEHKVFRSPFLRGSVVDTRCDVLRLLLTPSCLLTCAHQTGRASGLRNGSS